MAVVLPKPGPCGYAAVSRMITSKNGWKCRITHCGHDPESQRAFRQVAAESLTVRGQGLFDDGIGVLVRAQEIDDRELTQLGRSLVAQGKLAHSGRCLVSTSDGGLGGHELVEAGSAQETSVQLHLVPGVVVDDIPTVCLAGRGAREEKARSVHLSLEVLELRVEVERCPVLLLISLLQRGVG